MPDEVKNLCRLADIHSKSLLLQIVRQDDPQKMVALVEKIARDGGADARGSPKRDREAQARPAEGLRLQLRGAHQGVQAPAPVHEVPRRPRRSHRRARGDHQGAARQSIVGGRRSAVAVDSRQSGASASAVGRRLARRSAFGARHPDEPAHRQRPAHRSPAGPQVVASERRAAHESDVQATSEPRPAQARGSRRRTLEPATPARTSLHASSASPTTEASRRFCGTLRTARSTSRTRLPEAQTR